MPELTRLRLYSGLTVGVYVVLHLANHAAGLVGLESMEAVRPIFAGIWQSWPGAIVLYGALLIHFGLGLYSVYERRTLRMPPWEWAQLALGLLIVPAILFHTLPTHLYRWWADYDIGYVFMASVFRARPILYAILLGLLVVTWFHFATGLHFWLRTKRSYRRLVPWLYPLAVLWPVLAILGVLNSVRSLEMMPPAEVTAVMAPVDALGMAFVERVYGVTFATIGVFLGLIALAFVARWVRRRLALRGGSYTVTLPDRRALTAPLGQSLLEVLRENGVPHASVCGGRGRCTTCRVRVLSALSSTRAASALEAQSLQRIGAGPDLRLACLLHPAEDLVVLPLIDPHVSAAHSLTPGGVIGREQVVTSLYVNLREGSRLAENRLPFDVVFVLNQFFAEMAAAFGDTGGHYVSSSGDGLLVLYGLETTPEDGARQALMGAAEMFRRIGELNHRLHSELDRSLTIGVGLHTGEAVVGTMGPPSAPVLSALGDNVNLAAQLATEGHGLRADLVVSASTAAFTELHADRFDTHSVMLSGRKEPVEILATTRARWLETE